MEFCICFRGFVCSLPFVRFFIRVFVCITVLNHIFSKICPVRKCDVRKRPAVFVFFSLALVDGNVNASAIKKLMCFSRSLLAKALDRFSWINGFWRVDANHTDGFFLAIVLNRQRVAISNFYHGIARFRLINCRLRNLDKILVWFFKHYGCNKKKNN